MYRCWAGFRSVKIVFVAKITNSGLKFYTDVFFFVGDKSFNDFIPARQCKYFFDILYVNLTRMIALSRG